MVYGTKVGELEQETYKKIRGKLRGTVPRHVNIDIKRKRDKGIVEIWSRRPDIVADAIESLIGEK